MTRYERFVRWLQNLTDFQPGSGTLRRQYWRTLEARLHLFERRQTPENAPTIDRMKALLSGRADWDNAFAADLLTPQLLAANEIDTEFASRLEEARLEWPARTQPMQKAYADRWSQLQNESDKRALLQEFVNQSLWQFAVVDQERAYRSKTILWSAVFFILSLIFLFGAFRALDEQSLDLSSWSGSWWLVALAGWSGASFSWLTRMRDTVRENNMDVLKDLSRWHYGLSRAFIGVGAAVGFVSGSVFPVLDPTQSEERVTIVAQAFRALASTASQCSDADAENREALLAAATENFRSLLVVHVRERRQSGGGPPSGLWVPPDYVDFTDDEWLRRAGLQSAAQPRDTPPPARALILCEDPTRADARWTIRNALLAQPGTLALLLFWSFVAGFSEKLVPSILDRAGEKIQT
jgi:hypothetical protein